MPAPKPAFRLPLKEAREMFVAAQGLAPQPGRSVAEALEETGFVRTLGGVDVYLAVRARVPGLRRAGLDAAVAAGEAQVIPAVRGCIYLVPRRDVPLALRVAALLSRSRDEREHEKAGIRPGEVEEVGAAVLQVLGERGPLTTDALRRALPTGVVRSLGDAGKKLGISSPLPAALRRLEFGGRVERTLESQRLDSERYLWRVTARSPFDGVSLPDDPIDLYAGLARIFFHGAGLGTQKDFAAWAGIPQRDAKAAMERADLLPVAIEEVPEIHYLPEERRGLLETAPETAARAIALLPFEDNLLALHGGPALLVDAAHHATPVPVWGSDRMTTLGEARYMGLRSVVAEGKIAGIWEYDPDAQAVVAAGFAGLSKATRAGLAAATEDLARFLEEDLGHGRSFSLDTDDDLRLRSGQVRSVAMRVGVDA
jgi:Winged helix DNA-binding domain